MTSSNPISNVSVTATPPLLHLKIHVFNAKVPRIMADLLQQIQLSYSIDSLVGILRQMLPFFQPLKHHWKTYCQLAVIFQIQRETEQLLRDICCRVNLHFSSDLLASYHRFCDAMTIHPVRSKTITQYLTELQALFHLPNDDIDLIHQLALESSINHLLLRYRIGAAVLHIVRSKKFSSPSVKQILSWTQCSLHTLYAIQSRFSSIIPSSSEDRTSKHVTNTKTDHTTKRTVNAHGDFYMNYQRYHLDQQLAGQTIVIHFSSDGKQFDVLKANRLIGHFFPR